MLTVTVKFRFGCIFGSCHVRLDFAHSSIHPERKLQTFLSSHARVSFLRWSNPRSLPAYLTLTLAARNGSSSKLNSWPIISNPQVCRSVNQAAHIHTNMHHVTALTCDAFVTGLNLCIRPTTIKDCIWCGAGTILMLITKLICLEVSHNSPSSTFQSNAAQLETEITGFRLRNSFHDAPPNALKIKTSNTNFISFNGTNSDDLRLVSQMYS